MCDFADITVWIWLSGSGENVFLLNPLLVLAPKKKNTHAGAFLFARDDVSPLSRLSRRAWLVGAHRAALQMGEKAARWVPQRSEKLRKRCGSIPIAFQGTARRLSKSQTLKDNPRSQVSNPSPATISSIHNGFELWILVFSLALYLLTGAYFWECVFYWNVLTPFQLCWTGLNFFGACWR